jgi:two-component system NtrC family response regulator
MEKMGHEPQTVTSLQDGKRLAVQNAFDLILLDLQFPEGNGLDILPALLKTPSSPEIIIITGTDDPNGAEIAFKSGAWDYIQKPFMLHEVSLPIARALQYRAEKQSLDAPRILKRVGIVGESPAMIRCLEEVSNAAASDASMLIIGETGTGKELFAKAIHENSRRSGGNFVVVDCGALPDNLVESTLFGHEKGAFTGAEKTREGLISQADGGTVFFDEIGELPMSIQKTLLRVLQERRFRPVGGAREVVSNFRLLAATNRNLEQMAEQGRFRRDLLFRIRSMELHLPPLRLRKTDIHELVLHYLARLSQRYETDVKGISPEFLNILLRYDWPGNVRELINVLENAVASSLDLPTLYPKHLPGSLRRLAMDDALHPEVAADSADIDDLERDESFPTLREYRTVTEKKYLQTLLQRSGGKRETACRLSGLSQSRLYALLKQYGMPSFKDSGSS